LNFLKKPSGCKKSDTAFFFNLDIFLFTKRSYNKDKFLMTLTSSIYVYLQMKNAQSGGF